jgi:hypothetical protein
MRKLPTNKQVKKTSKKIGSRKKIKVLLKRVINTFNYETEPKSIDTEDWTDGHP